MIINFRWTNNALLKINTKFWEARNLCSSYKYQQDLTYWRNKTRNNVVCKLDSLNFEAIETNLQKEVLRWICCSLWSIRLISLYNVGVLTRYKELTCVKEQVFDFVLSPVHFFNLLFLLFSCCYLWLNSSWDAVRFTKKRRTWFWFPGKHQRCNPHKVLYEDTWVVFFYGKYTSIQRVAM